MISQGMPNLKTSMRAKANVGTLLAISSALHLVMGATLGAKYWWDTISYFQLADALRDTGSLHALYSGPFGIEYQHLMPGLPVLILVLEKLFGSALWPALAIFQNGLDVIATVYLATGFSGKIGRKGQFAIVVLTALFPYYSAFHNAILTESFTASSVMLMVGVAVRCLDSRIELTRALVAILLIGTLGGNFRSYVFLVSGGLSALIIYCTARFSRPLLYVVSVVTVFAGASIFPAYRAAAGIEFFYPRVDALMLAYANLVNWDLDERSRKAVEDAVSDPIILDKLEHADKNVDPDDIVKMVDDLVARGLSRSEAAKQISRASWIVRTQSWEVMSRQLQLTLSSLGFQRIATCCTPSRAIQNGFTAERLLKHLQYYYQWNAVVERTSYVSEFDQFISGYRAAPRYYGETVIDWYASRVRPYVRDRRNPFRNFFGLNSISPDALVILGLLGFVVMSWPDWRFFAILGLLVIPVYVASLYATFVGDNRHAHFLWPFYILGTVALLQRIPYLLRPRPRRPAALKP
jgi:hypothetical protein